MNLCRATLAEDEVLDDAGPLGVTDRIDLRGTRHREHLLHERAELTAGDRQVIQPGLAVVQAVVGAVDAVPVGDQRVRDREHVRDVPAAAMDEHDRVRLLRRRMAVRVVHACPCNSAARGDAEREHETNRLHAAWYTFCFP